IQWLPGVHRENSVDLPSAENPLLDARLHPTLVSAERQLINVALDERMGPVIARTTAVQGWSAIHNQTAVIVGEVDRLSIGICRGQQEALCEAVIQLCLQPVIARAGPYPCTGLRSAAE